MRHFGNENCRCTARKTCCKRDVTCAASHNLNDCAALVRVAGIAELIYHLDNRVHCRIVADGVLRALDIVVNRSGDTDTRDTCFGQIRRTSEGAVAADCDNAAHLLFLADCLCLENVVPFLELGAASGVDCGTAALDNIGNASHIEVDKLSVEQAVVAAKNSDNFKALKYSGSCDCSDCRVHSGAVAAACKDTDFLFHFNLSSFL